MPINYIANKQPNICGSTCAFAGPTPYNRSLHDIHATINRQECLSHRHMPNLTKSQEDSTSQLNPCVYSSRWHMTHSGTPTGLWTVSGAGSPGRLSTMAKGLRPHA